MNHKITKWMAGGSIATAFLGSCCALPLLLLSLGIGGMGFVTVLASYRSYFIGATFLMLGVSFYLVYGKKVLPCDETRLCNVKSQKVTKIALWMTTVLVLLFLVGPSLIANFLS